MPLGGPFEPMGTTMQSDAELRARAGVRITFEAEDHLREFSKHEETRFSRLSSVSYASHSAASHAHVEILCPRVTVRKGCELCLYAAYVYNRGGYLFHRTHTRHSTPEDPRPKLTTNVSCTLPYHSVAVSIVAACSGVQKSRDSYFFWAAIVEV